MHLKSVTIPRKAFDVKFEKVDVAILKIGIQPLFKVRHRRITLDDENIVIDFVAEEHDHEGLDPNWFRFHLCHVELGTNAGQLDYVLNPKHQTTRFDGNRVTDSV